MNSIFQVFTSRFCGQTPPQEVIKKNEDLLEASRNLKALDADPRWDAWDRIRTGLDRAWEELAADLPIEDTILRRLEDRLFACKNAMESSKLQVKALVLIEKTLLIATPEHPQFKAEGNARLKAISECKRAINSLTALDKALSPYASKLEPSVWRRIERFVVAAVLLAAAVAVGIAVAPFIPLILAGVAGAVTAFTIIAGGATVGAAGAGVGYLFGIALMLYEAITMQSVQQNLTRQCPELQKMLDDIQENARKQLLSKPRMLEEVGDGLMNEILRQPRRDEDVVLLREYVFLVLNSDIEDKPKLLNELLDRLPLNEEGLLAVEQRNELQRIIDSRSNIVSPSDVPERVLPAATPALGKSHTNSVSSEEDAVASWSGKFNTDVASIPLTMDLNEVSEIEADDIELPEKEKAAKRFELLLEFSQMALDKGYKAKEKYENGGKTTEVAETLDEALQPLQVASFALEEACNYLMAPGEINELLFAIGKPIYEPTYGAVLQKNINRVIQLPLRDDPPKEAERIRVKRNIDELIEILQTDKERVHPEAARRKRNKKVGGPTDRPVDPADIGIAQDAVETGRTARLKSEERGDLHALTRKDAFRKIWTAHRRLRIGNLLRRGAPDGEVRNLMAQLRALAANLVAHDVEAAKHPKVSKPG